MRYEADVAADEVLSLLVSGTCMVTDRPHMLAAPLDLLQIICDGLRAPEGATPTSQPHPHQYAAYAEILFPIGHVVHRSTGAARDSAFKDPRSRW